MFFTRFYFNKAVNPSRCIERFLSMLISQLKIITKFVHASFICGYNLSKFDFLIEKKTETKT